MTIKQERESGAGYALELDGLARIFQAREFTMAALARQYPDLSPDAIRAAFAHPSGTVNYDRHQ